MSSVSGRLAGRVAIVTGSTKGIGYGVARRLAAEGAQVVINGTDGEALERSAAAIQRDFGTAPRTALVDVTDRNAVWKMVGDTVAGCGAVDIVVNNAWGRLAVNRLENKTDEDFTSAFDMAFFAALWTMQAAFPGMRERGRGHIVNVCSLNGTNAHMYTAQYNVAKEALRTLTRTAAREWAPYGIVVNAICPFARATRFDTLFGERADEVSQQVGATNPMGRMGDPETDIGGVVAFLASDDARYLTGNTLFVDGGAHINGVQWAPVPEEDRTDAMQAAVWSMTESSSE